MTKAAISTDWNAPGLETGSRYDRDEKGRYALSLWRIPYYANDGCRFRIPSMTGVGGSYVQFMPNGLIGFRYSDGGYYAYGTWDSRGLREAADDARSMCDG